MNNSFTTMQIVFNHVVGLTCIVLWKTHNSLADKWRDFLVYKERDFKSLSKKEKEKRKETYMNNSFTTMHFF